MEIIDVHAHTSNHLLWNLHAKTAAIADLESLAEQYGIKKIILMATYFPLKNSGLNNTELLKRISGRNLFSAFGSLDVENNFENGLSELEELAKNKQIIGIKLYPGYQNFWQNNCEIFPIYELAQKYNLPVMFHGGELHHCCGNHGAHLRCRLPSCLLEERQYQSKPYSMAEAFRKFPRVNFIVSHLANPDFEDLRLLMLFYENIYTDISGQFVSGRKGEDTEKYRRFIVGEIEKFLKLPNGAERVLFGTDFPIQSYASSIDLIERLNISPLDKEKIFHKNAERLLNF